MKTYTEADIIKLIKADVAASSQTELAYCLGVQQAYVSKLINGQRAITDRIAEHYGFTRKTQLTTVFVKKASAK